MSTRTPWGGSAARLLAWTNLLILVSVIVALAFALWLSIVNQRRAEASLQRGLDALRCVMLIPQAERTEATVDRCLRP